MAPGPRYYNGPTERAVAAITAEDNRSVLMATVAVHVAVLQLFLAGFAHVDALDIEMQILAGHGVVEIHVDHAHADLLDRYRTRAEVGLQDDLLTRDQLL